MIAEGWIAMRCRPESSSPRAAVHPLKRSEAHSMRGANRSNAEWNRTTSRFLAERGYTRQTQSRESRRADESGMCEDHHTGTTPLKVKSITSNGNWSEQIGSAITD